MDGCHEAMTAWVSSVSHSHINWVINQCVCVCVCFRTCTNTMCSNCKSMTPYELAIHLLIAVNKPIKRPNSRLISRRLVQINCKTSVRKRKVWTRETG